MSSESEIIIQVKTDAEKIPEQITWKAPQAGFTDIRAAEALMLSLWDPKERNSMRLDLWTKEMTIDDMKQFIYQGIILMSETLENATGEKEMAEQMRDFARCFAEKYGFV